MAVVDVFNEHPSGIDRIDRCRERLTTHRVNMRDVNYARYHEECLRESIDPHISVEVGPAIPG